MHLPHRRHAFDDARPGSRVRVRVSLHAEPSPPSGVVDPPFRWEDVLDGPPPGDAERGPPVFACPQPEIVTAGVRIETSTLVVVLEHGSVEVEEAVYVSQRALANVIESERSAFGVKLDGARANAEARARRADHPLHEAVHLAHAKVVGGARAFTRAVAATPDRLANRIRRAYAILRTPEGRSRVAHGLLEPRGLTREEKAVTLTVGVSAIIAALLVAHFAVTLAVPDLARPWRTLFFLFLYAFTTSVGVPLPIEPVLLAATMSARTHWAILTALCAKVLAAWMVFFLGDEVNDRLRARAQNHPRLARALDRCETFARRFGLFAVAAFIATPGLPDAIALFVFGSLDMRLWKFLLGVAIGGAILYAGLTYGLLAVFG